MSPDRLGVLGGDRWSMLRMLPAEEGGEFGDRVAKRNTKSLAFDLFGKNMAAQLYGYDDAVRRMMRWPHFYRAKPVHPAHLPIKCRAFLNVRPIQQSRPRACIDDFPCDLRFDGNRIVVLAIPILSTMRSCLSTLIHHARVFAPSRSPTSGDPCTENRRPNGRR